MFLLSFWDFGAQLVSEELLGFCVSVWFLSFWGFCAQLVSDELLGFCDWVSKLLGFCELVSELLDFVGWFLNFASLSLCCNICKLVMKSHLHPQQNL